MSWPWDEAGTRLTQDLPATALCDRIAPGAIHDSCERSDAPKRRSDAASKQNVQKILRWVTHDDRDEQPRKIFWLAGPEGSGKTEIASSVADICEEMGLLAATFFFSSSSASQKTLTKYSFVATLAYQMALLEGFGPLADKIMAAIERDPIVFDKRVKSQLEGLILKPLREVQAECGLVGSQRVLVINGISNIVAKRALGSPPSEEFQEATQADQVEILSSLLYAVMDPAFPFRVIIASRPEGFIKDFLVTKATDMYRELLLEETASLCLSIASHPESDNSTRNRDRAATPRLPPLASYELYELCPSTSSLSLPPLQIIYEEPRHISSYRTENAPFDVSGSICRLGTAQGDALLPSSISGAAPYSRSQNSHLLEEELSPVTHSSVHPDSCETVRGNREPPLTPSRLFLTLAPLTRLAGRHRHPYKRSYHDVKALRLLQSAM